MAKRTYRSMQGKIVDMELLASKNELAPAVGNVRVNARGDELGPGGKIIRKREDIMSEYYNKTPNAVADEQFVRRAVPAFENKPIVEKNTVKKEVRNKNANDQTDS
jgi:hypothetical protein